MSSRPEPILASGDLLKYLKDRLKGAVGTVKHAIINAPDGPVNVDKLTQEVLEEFSVSPIHFLGDEMFTGVVKVNDQNQIEMEFLVPFEGDNFVILKHCDGPGQTNAPSAFFSPGVTNDEDAPPHTKKCISYTVVDDQHCTGAEFVALAKLTLGKIGNSIAYNNNAIDNFNKNALHRDVKNAISLAQIAVKRLQAADHALNKGGK